jgi:5-methylcytosine-specific restriction endonuclease McrA
MCQPCRRERPGYRDKRPHRERAVQRWTCGRCGEECQRIETRGRFPRLCGSCRPNGGAHIPDRLRAEVYERDGWVCGICTEPVDANLIGSRSEWRPSIDHIIPRSAGGDEQDANLRLAHFWCNAVRGAELYEDAMFRVA